MIQLQGHMFLHAEDPFFDVSCGMKVASDKVIS